MKEVLDQRPMSMIANTGTPPKYIAIAAPERMECVPTSCRRMRSLTSPNATTPSPSAVSTIFPVTCSIFPLCQTAETGVSGPAPL